MSETPSFFTRFNALIDNGWAGALTQTQMAVYLVHLRHTTNKGVCWPGARRVAECLGHTHVEHLQKARRELVTMGLMNLLEAGGGRTAAKYQLPVPGPIPTGGRSGPGREGGIGLSTKRGNGPGADFVPGADSAQPAGADSADFSTKMNSPLNSTTLFGEQVKAESGKTGKPKKQRTDSSASASFDALWLAWPGNHSAQFPRSERKEGKAQCLNKWQNDDLDRIAPHVMAALDLAKKSEKWRKEGGEFIPGPLSWLNKAPWTEIQEPGSVPSPAPQKPTMGLVSRVFA